ncbi:hypothetical protein QR98_0043620 [Sarcoptes scabiei]|nr:hypothetical protein QR98_0043620 [Sarcoptes scabiei]
MPGYVLDFGMKNFHLKHLVVLNGGKFQNYLTIFKWIDSDYEQNSIAITIKMILQFIKVYANYRTESHLKSFIFYILAIEEALKKSVLFKEIEFLIELYFNLLIIFFEEISQFNAEISDENIIEIKKAIDSIGTILNEAISNRNILLIKGQVFRYHLISMHEIDHYLRENHSDNLHRLFQKLFGEIYSRFAHEFDSNPNGVLRLFSESILHKDSDYFCMEFHLSEKDLDFEKKLFRMWKDNIHSITTSSTTVSFDSDDKLEKKKLGAICREFDYQILDCGRKKSAIQLSEAEISMKLLPDSESTLDFLLEKVLNYLRQRFEDSLRGDSSSTDSVTFQQIYLPLCYLQNISR